MEESISKHLGFSEKEIREILKNEKIQVIEEDLANEPIKKPRLNLKVPA